MSQGGTQSQSLQLRRTVARDRMSDSNDFTEITYLKYRGRSIKIKQIDKKI
jgi:hypothetical protein